MHLDRIGFCGDVVPDSVNMATRNEDSNLDQRYIYIYRKYVQKSELISLQILSRMLSSSLNATLTLSKSPAKHSIDMA